MSICRMCHRSIPDGSDFCPECEQKRQNQADESYLDSLLSSVSAPSKPSVPPVRVLPETVEPAVEVPAQPRPEAQTVQPVPEPEAQTVQDVPEPEAQTVQDVPESEAQDVSEAQTDSAAEETIPEQTAMPDEPEIISDGADDLFTVNGEEVQTAQEDAADIGDIFDALPPETGMDDEIQDEEPGPVAEEAVGEAAGEAETSEDVDELLDGLLADFEEPKDEGSDENALAPDEIEDIFAAAEGADPESTEDGQGADDLFDISSGPEEPAEGAGESDGEAGDGEAADITEAVEEEGAEPIEAAEELGAEIDPFAISAEDISVPTEGVAEASEFLSEQDLEESAMNEGAEPDVDRIMSDIESGDFEREIASIKPVEEKKKPKKSWFMKLFGNIKEDRTPEQEEAYRKKLQAEEEKKKEAAELKKKRAEESKEEKAARKEQEKAEKAEKAKVKAEEAKKKKEEAKELARQKKEAKKAIEEAEIDEGQINKVGAAILVVLFGIILAIIIFGTNIYTYKLSINRAQEEFDIRHYNDAYYEVYGLDIKDEDIELYDRIMTVMYVNSQLNSYEYYMRAKDRDKALDSLLKGLNKYDKYLQLATMLDIKSDLNYVKSNILAELDSEFGMSEEEAYVLAKVSNAVDYSEYIYSLLGTYEVDGLE